MRIEAIAVGQNPPYDVNAIIEIPLGGVPIKYELDKEAGTLVVDRFLYTPMVFLAITGSCRIRSPKTATRSTCWSATPAPSCPAR